MRKSVSKSHGGQLVRIEYSDESGRPALHPIDGIAKVEIQHDERGNPVVEQFFGIDGKPVLHRQKGVAKIVLSYDQEGNSTATSFFGVAGEPVLHASMGFAVCSSSYGRTGKIERSEHNYFGTAGEPVVRRCPMCAKIVEERDSKDDTVREYYYDLNGELAPCPDTGVASEFTRFSNGVGVETRFYDAEGRPVINRVCGYAAKETVRNPAGDGDVARFLGPDGRLIAQSDGVAMVVRKTNTQGRLIELAYFGPQGAPVMLPQLDGYHKIVMTLDSAGRCVEKRSYGLEGEPVLHNGYARVASAYDDAGRLTEESYYGLQGEPVQTLKGGVARCVRSYDELGIATKQWFDLHDRPIRPRALQGQSQSAADASDGENA